MRRGTPLPFWAEDWLSSPTVAAMDLDVQGAYIRLLAYCWLDDDCGVEGYLLARLSGLGSQAEGYPQARLQGVAGKSWSEATDLQACFIDHPTIPGKVTNAKLYQLHLKDVEFREKCAKAGRKGVEAKRKGTLNQPSSQASATLKLPSPSPSPIKATAARDPSSTESAVPPPSTKPPKKKPSPLQLAADEVGMAYVRHMHTHRQIMAPAPAKTDRARASALAALAGDPSRLEEACELARRYVELEDAWLREQGWPWRVFPSRLTQLQVARAGLKIPEVMRG